jgi:hypothetical protein
MAPAPLVSILELEWHFIHLYISNTCSQGLNKDELNDYAHKKLNLKRKVGRKWVIHTRKKIIKIS